MNNVIKLAFCLTLLQLFFLVSLMVFLHTYFVISRLLLTFLDSNQGSVSGFINPGFLLRGC